MSAVPSLPPPAVAATAGAIAGYAGILVALFLQGAWLLDPGGLPLTGDFVTFWAGGQLAGDGRAAAVYDRAALKAAEIVALGHGFEGTLGWYYPPHFLLLVWPLHLLPLVHAQLLWTAATFALFCCALWRIGGLSAMLIGIALPPVLAAAVAGQTGFLVAGLFGLALWQVERRPILAGLLLGALTVKPQFGLLVPLALLAGGHWRAMVAASASGLALAGASAALFGAEAWVAFFASLGASQDALLAEGVTGFGKLQSLFGLLRHAGLPLAPSLVLQGVLTAAAAIATAIMWRRPCSPDLKAAGLVAAAALATPYVFLYDLVILALPIAFLSRAGLDRTDGILVALAMAACFAFPFMEAPSGFLGSLGVAAAIARRTRTPRPSPGVALNAS